MPTNFHLFGSAHLFILGSVPALAAILAVVQRRLKPGTRWLRIGLAAVLLLDTALYYGHLATHGQITFPDHLPLELCDASLGLVIVALSGGAAMLLGDLLERKLTPWAAH